MTYADQTVKDPNPVKRWLQHQRLHDALQVLRDANPKSLFDVLDFGGGDGELLHRCLATYPQLRACLYEPTPGLRGEAEARLKKFERVRIVGDLKELEGRRFDLVFSLEVFEHLPERETQDAIGAIHDLTKPGGRIVIGVPHEVFLPALVKGLFRMVRRPGGFDARPSNIMRAVAGRRLANRPKKEITPGFSYYRHHVGFDHRELERALERKFEVVSRWFSPAKMLGSVFNSEVYYLLRRAEGGGGRKSRK